ncbi:MAG: hypothetical protein V1839_01105 [archaeon]
MPKPVPKPVEVKHEVQITGKSVEDIKELHKRHKELLSSLDVHGKNLATLEKEFDEHREEVLDEIKAINKNLGPLYDKDAKLEKDICDLTLAGKQLISEIEKVSRKAKDVKDIVTSVESAYSTDNMKKIIDQINEVNGSIRAIQSKDESAVNVLQRVDRRIGAVEKHSQLMDAERAEMKASADALVQYASELKETVGGYSNQLVDLSSKASANISKTSDIDQQLRSAMGRVGAIEGQLIAAEKLSEIMQQHSRIITEIAKRLEYLEKSTVRTMVLD